LQAVVAVDTVMVLQVLEVVVDLELHLDTQ
jgi:hypothetical protein